MDINAPGNISIMIADDHLLFVDGLRLLLQGQQDFFIIGIANSGKELLDLLNRHSPQILLLDLNMPGINGLDALGYIRRTNHLVKIIMLSTYTENHLVEKAKKTGANGYIVKTFGPDELVKVIRLVVAGETYFPKRKQPLSDNYIVEDHFLKQFSLTKREKEILNFIREDFTNSEISQKLFLSVYTVETHRKNIMQKLGLKSPGALMRFIIEHNL